MKIKVGDLVRVKNWCEAFTTNTEWFLAHIKELDPKWLINYAYGDASNVRDKCFTDQVIYEVLYVQDNMLLIGVHNNVYRVYLIEDCGVELLSETGGVENEV